MRTTGRDECWANVLGPGVVHSSSLGGTGHLAARWGLVNAFALAAIGGHRLVLRPIDVAIAVVVVDASYRKVEGAPLRIDDCPDCKTALRFDQTRPPVSATIDPVIALAIEVAARADTVHSAPPEGLTLSVDHPKSIAGVRLLGDAAEWSDLVTWLEEWLITGPDVPGRRAWAQRTIEVLHNMVKYVDCTQGAWWRSAVDLSGPSGTLGGWCTLFAPHVIGGEARPPPKHAQLRYLQTGVVTCRAEMHAEGRVRVVEVAVGHAALRLEPGRRGRPSVVEPRAAWVVRE